MEAPTKAETEKEYHDKLRTLEDLAVDMCIWEEERAILQEQQQEQKR